VSRARKRVADGRPRFAVDEDEHRRILERFVAASREGDVDALVDLLAPDAVLTSDGGPNRKAARLPVRGRDRVVRFVRKIGPRVMGGRREVSIEDVNGAPAFVVHDGREVVLVGMVETEEGRVTALRWVSNPDKLEWV
jgi:RNA polymerase sigma-70 factor (ECF subfamily)